jgi:chromosomal replication initiator protein
MDSAEIWKNCINDVGKHISSQHLATWFKPIKVLGGGESTLELEVPNRFFLEWIKDHYALLIHDVLRKNTKREFALKWKVSVTQQVKTEHEPIKIPIKKKTPTKKKKGVTSKNPLSSKYTFDKFVVGKDNEFAHAACIAVTKHLGSKYNPLFIYGGVGLGKTHLLQAIGNKVLEHSEDVNICYYTSERFMNEFINYVSRQKMAEFRKKFRNVDLLLIDDIQFWSGKERTQEEFFHTFNALYEAHKQIIVTSDKFPKNIKGMEERLRSRFEWGLVADIQPPDTETKVAIIKTKARAEGTELPNDVALWLASINSSNVRELEGYLNRVIAVSSLTGKEITLAMSKDALKNLTGLKDERILSIEEIQKAVVTHFNIKISDLKSKRRHKTIALPRQIAMYLARKYGNFSYPEIGDSFGGKDHSTAIHAVKKIEKVIKEDTSIRLAVNRLINDLGVG